MNLRNYHNAGYIGFNDGGHINLRRTPVQYTLAAGVGRLRRRFETTDSASPFAQNELLVVIFGLALVFILVKIWIWGF